MLPNHSHQKSIVQLAGAQDALDQLQDFMDTVEGNWERNDKVTPV